MADPRLDAILGRLGGAGDAAMPGDMPLEEMAPEGPAGDPITGALDLLGPLAESDPRIAEIVAQLQAIAGGPADSADTALEAPPEPADEAAY